MPKFHLLATYDEHKYHSPILFYFFLVLIVIIKINVKILAKSFLTIRFSFSYCHHVPHSVGTKNFKN